MKEQISKMKEISDTIREILPNNNFVMVVVGEKGTDQPDVRVISNLKDSAYIRKLFAQLADQTNVTNEQTLKRNDH